MAMKTNEFGALVPAKTIDELVRFVPQINESVDLELKQLINVDSTNIEPSFWTKLAKTIEGCCGVCDGVIVIVGTDTMAYVAGQYH